MQGNKKNIAVFASGSGTNFQAIAQAVRKGRIRACLKLLVVDKEKAYVRRRAERFKIRHIYINPKEYKGRVAFDRELVRLLKKEKINLVVLAGFMRILSPYFVRAFKNKILNIHPALLPAFKGDRAIKDAHEYGVKVTGVTVHFVDEEVDHGPIILQEEVKIRKHDTLKALEEKIHRTEHKLYPEAIQLVLDNKLRIRGRCVKKR